MVKETERSRLSCKYADQYYAAQFNITKEEAKSAYKCSDDSGLQGIPECPFGFLTECLETIEESIDWKRGVVTGLTNSKGVYAKLVPISYENSSGIRQPGYVHYECTNCKGIIQGGTPDWMAFCPNCGARVE